MNTPALVLMLITMILVTGMTAYFLFKVLVIPPKSGPDSYSENDDEDEPQNLKP